MLVDIICLFCTLFVAIFFSSLQHFLFSSPQAFVLPTPRPLCCLSEKEEGIEGGRDGGGPFGKEVPVMPDSPARHMYV